MKSRWIQDVLEVSEVEVRKSTGNLKLGMAFVSYR